MRKTISLLLVLILCLGAELSASEALTTEQRVEALEYKVAFLENLLGIRNLSDYSIGELLFKASNHDEKYDGDLYVYCTGADYVESLLFIHLSIFNNTDSECILRLPVASINNGEFFDVDRNRKISVAPHSQMIGEIKFDIEDLGYYKEEAESIFLLELGYRIEIGDCVYYSSDTTVRVNSVIPVLHGEENADTLLTEEQKYRALEERVGALESKVAFLESRLDLYVGNVGSFGELIRRFTGYNSFHGDVYVYCTGVKYTEGLLTINLTIKNYTDSECSLYDPVVSINNGNMIDIKNDTISVSPGSQTSEQIKINMKDIGYGKEKINEISKFELGYKMQVGQYLYWSSETIAEIDGAVQALHSESNDDSHIYGEDQSTDYPEHTEASASDPAHTPVPADTYEPESTIVTEAKSTPSPNGDFSIRDGIRFGMTMTEVTRIEKNAGFEIETSEPLYGSDNVSSVLIVRGKIAGMENSEVHYLFDKNGKLYASTFWLRINDTLESDYNTIQNALERKYGTPVNAWLPVANRIGFEPNDYLAYIGLARKNKNVLPYYNSWLVGSDDGNYVVIAHYKESAVIYGITTNMHVVGYQWYSAEEITNEFNNIRNEADERDNDI